MRKRYVASSEKPMVLCSYGSSPAESFKQMYKLLEEEDVRWFSSCSVNIIDDCEKDQYAVTVYV